MLRRLCPHSGDLSGHNCAELITKAAVRQRCITGECHRFAIGSIWQSQLVQKRLLSRKRKTLYDTLEVSEKASPKEIKSAFYRLSMKHHPDRNSNKSEAASAFKDVSEAYQVLSNQMTRNEYDERVLGLNREPTSSSFKPVQTKPRAPPPTGRSHIYNFDEFYKKHYGTKLRRDYNLRKEYESYEEKMEARAKDATPTGLFVFLIVACALGVGLSQLLPTSSNGQSKRKN